jgi:hypothetical protein
MSPFPFSRLWAFEYSSCFIETKRFWSGVYRQDVTGNFPTRQSRLLLNLLNQHQARDFNAVVTGNESDFRYVYTQIRSQVAPFVRRDIEASKGYDHHFLDRDLVPRLQRLTKGVGWGGFNQQYFIEGMVSLLSAQKSRNHREKQPLDLIIHLDSSICDDDG